MKKLNLNIGSIVYHQNEKVEIVSQVDMSSVMVKSFSDSKKRVVFINELHTSYLDESSQNNEHIVGFENEQWDEAKRRLGIINPLLNSKRTKEKVELVAQENGLHFTTLYRWIKAYEQAGVLSVLVPKYAERGGKGEVRIQEESELIMNKVIQDLYLHKQKLTPKRIYQEIKIRCINASVNVPHENTVRNRIKKLSDKNVLKMRESRRNAERLYRNTDGMFPSGNYPLDVIQIDHTPVDLILVDEEYRQPLRRPFLTLAIDVYSRMITGFYISLEEPSYFSVSQCLTQTILQKDKLLREHDVEGEWNVWGIPRTIHLDNGQDFRSIELQRTCEQFGISIEWRPVARPQFGAHIERLIGTSMQEVHTLPGTTFSNIQQRGEYDSSAEAVMTLMEFEKWFFEYVVNVYNKRVHSMIGMAPEKKYEIGIFGDENVLGKGLPEIVEDEEYLRLSFLPSIERSVQQTGISVDKIHYYHDVLRRWIKAKDKHGKGRKFIFKIDPRDISSIWFFDPEIKEYFEIPYRNVTYPRISRWELRSVKQYLAQKNIEGYDETVIFKAYEKMIKIRDESASKTKTARREVETKKLHTRKKNSDFSNIQSDKGSRNAYDGEMEDLFKDIKAFDDIDVGGGNND